VCSATMAAVRGRVLPVRAEASKPDSATLRRIVAAWPYKPYGSNRTDSSARDGLVVDRLHRTLATEGVQTWCVENGEAVALAILQPLAWDSRVLRLQAGRLELIATGSYSTAHGSAVELCRLAANGARECGIEHVSSRVDAADEACIHALENAGFLHVDALMTFAADPDVLIASAPQSSPYETTLALAADAAPLCEIAAASFTQGRFHADPSITAERAADVYRTWTAACCDRSAADDVIVARHGTEIAGFVACRVMHDTAGHLGQAAGTIPLIASNGAYRRCGVGAALIAAAARWFHSRGTAPVEVGTQLSNVAAARLYERAGFRMSAGSLTFRKMIER
jgi:ribosomal protein S18 acetylase RimI-like enzyme